MPVLTPSNGLAPHKQFWNVRCPKCGRGGAGEYKSAYLALKHWNELMERCRAMEKGVIWE